MLNLLVSLMMPHHCVLLIVDDVIFQPSLMITANVPSAKKLIVHGPDLASIPSQYPILEVRSISFYCN